MVEEKIYKLENGKELVIMESIKLNNIRYLLLCDNKSDDVKIGYEENNNLVFLNKDSKNFYEISMALFKKFKTKEI